MKQIVLNIFKDLGFITQEIAKENGINNLADNIFKLRNEGYKIAKVYLKYKSKSGKTIEQNYYELK